MEPDFKEACKAIQPYFDTFANHFIEELKNGVFMSDAEAFTKSKTKVEFLQQLKTTIINETTEGV